VATFLDRVLVYLGLRDDGEYGAYDQDGYPPDGGYPGDEHGGFVDPADDYARVGRVGYERGPEPEREAGADLRSLRPAPDVFPPSEPTVRTIPRDATERRRPGDRLRRPAWGHGVARRGAVARPVVAPGVLL